MICWVKNDIDIVLAQQKEFIDQESDNETYACLGVFKKIFTTLYKEFKHRLTTLHLTFLLDLKCYI